jgi:regulatory protein
VWQKKFDRKPASMSERAKQARFLGGRGFSADVVRKVLDWSDD